MRKSLKALPVLLLGTTCALMAQGAAPVAVLYSKGSISTPDGLFARNDGKTCTISWDGKGEKPVLALDFGAKSVGEIVINTPSPALAHAIYRATGVWHRELPITPEKILMAQT